MYGQFWFGWFAISWRIHYFIFLYTIILDFGYVEKVLIVTIFEFRNMQEHLHNALWVPEDRVSVEINSGIEPEFELLFSVSFALSKDIGMKCVRITT